MEEKREVVCTIVLKIHNALKPNLWHHSVIMPCRKNLSNFSIFLLRVLFFATFLHAKYNNFEPYSSFETREVVTIPTLFPTLGFTFVEGQTSILVLSVHSEPIPNIFSTVSFL